MNGIASTASTLKLDGRAEMAGEQLVRGAGTRRSRGSRARSQP